MPMSTKIVIKPVPHRKRTWSNQLEFLKKTVIPALKKCDYSFLFWAQVSPKDFPSYPSIVKSPMDFALIEGRLKEHFYDSAQQCVNDINTIFANCFIFSQAGEDITLIGEHLLRQKFQEKMEDFPLEEIPIERKKRGPGRKRAAVSPVGVGLDSDGHVSTRRHSMESIESQSNPGYIADGMEASPSGNGEVKGRPGAIISRIVKEPGLVPPLKVSNVPSRREREARPQTSMSLTGISGITSMTETKPRIKLLPSLNRCLKLINDLTLYRRRKFNWPFLEPVDPVSLNLPDYFQIVKNPMDLSTIRSNLENSVYTHKNQVKEHVDLMLANCYLYNGVDSLVAECGRQLGAFFEKKFNAIPDDIEQANSKRHKHKHHKLGKRHKRDRADEDFQDGGPHFLPEEVVRVNYILGRMQIVVERMASRCTDFDRLNRFILGYRESLNEEQVPTPAAVEPVVRQLQQELNNICLLNGVQVSGPANLSNGSVGGRAGRPRKRALPTDETEVKPGTTPTCLAGRGKRKRVEKPAAVAEEAVEMTAPPVAEPTTFKPDLETLPMKAEQVSGEHELTYEEKAALSQELQRVSDPNLLNELGAIVQRLEPHVQSASSGELNVDLTVLNNQTLLALKRAMDRAGKVSEEKADSEEDEEEEEDELDTTTETLACMKEEHSLLVNESTDISQLSSDAEVSAERPRGRRNRKAVNPVRNRGAATVLGATTAATVTGALPVKEDAVIEPEPELELEPEPEPEPEPTVLPTAVTPVEEPSEEAPLEPEPHQDETEEETPVSSPEKAAPVEPAQPPAPTTTIKESAAAPPPAAIVTPKKSQYAAPPPNPPSTGIKMPPSVKKNSSKSDNQPKPPPKIETSTPVRRRSSSVAQSSDEIDYNSNKSDSDDEHDKSPVKSEDEFRGQPLVSQQRPMRLYEIFGDDNSSKVDSKRKSGKNKEDFQHMKTLETQYRSVIIQAKQEQLTKQVQRDMATTQRREEEERRKREDEERKRREEQAKETRKMELKEQERKRLNDIRARNRRADMPLRQYADMTSFEKKIDFSLLSPRW